ncbi:tetrahydrofolate dehydrogenase/cyclohydrolase [Pelagophyceae sp. CCMP2097]|nr:tetrahydrofolate dehydrogenase/cyclohydrolase [Pelagophyceae sp. CCMP2097]
MQRIVLQLDYYAGGQFAGVFTALRRGLFAKRGLDVHILPPPTPGGEAAAVFQAQSLNTSALVLGSCEQNALLAWPTPEIVAIGAMLPRSPLALLSLSSDAPLKRLGAHADTVDVLKATLPGCKVELLGRADEAARFQKLLDGSLDAIQVYHTTEPLSLRQLGPRGKSAQMRPLCASADGGVGALDLGYAQSIFGVDAAVSDHASAARAFLEVLHDGWRLAAEDVLLAAEDISAFSAFESEEAMFGGVKRTDLNFHAACAARCAPAAVAMPPHMFDAQRWEKVDDGLLAALKPSTAWAHTPAKSLFEKTTATTKTAASFDGLAVARQLRADARHRAEAVLHERARRPRLAIVRVGDAEGALGGLDRAQAFPASSTPRGVESWYAKKRLLESDVTYASLPAGSSASAVIDAVKRASNDARNDGVLLERPLVGCSYEVTATMLQGVLDVSKDVDAELGGPTKPLTVEGVLHALDALDLDNSKASRKWCGLFDDDASSAPSSILAGGADVVVVGRSAKLGLPLAKALISRDATVTVVHSQTRAITLANAVKSADVVFSCAGSPGLITASMLKEGSVVFNVGTKYDAPTKTLSADAADDVASVARLLTPTPHGIGPLCTAVLARRVVRRAEERALKIPDGLPASWAVLEKNASTCATRSVSFPSLSAAVEALKAVSAVGDSLGHHPTANLNEAQACEQVHGCVLRLSLTTFSKGKRLTPLDVKAAVAIDAALEAVQRRPALDVQKLDYHLPDERIARYVAAKRGSAKARG